MRREKSGREHRGRGRGRGRGCISSPSPRRTPPSSIHTTDKDDGRRRDILSFHNHNFIQGIIKPFIESYTDVLGDGNCGFLVVADYMYKTEWMMVRNNVANEVQTYSELYEPMYCSDVASAI
ncbi:OLC1v1030311C1 [Oldenlandia corymbosa var. corymbosa]|uniref:OLC1v1030311C1 n=1 Tax=Oldenlandia corymbosa var. corymbosa TaxID=529605 RepID=A0AAV1CGS5_OLDCO|nr:OLC1v1030311C1 [Oldenlandia corymbosa var. corymbosa]